MEEGDGSERALEVEPGDPLVLPVTPNTRRLLFNLALTAPFLGAVFFYHAREMVRDEEPPAAIAAVVVITLAIVVGAVLYGVRRTRRGAIRFEAGGDVQISFLGSETRLSPGEGGHVVVAPSRDGKRWLIAETEGGAATVVPARSFPTLVQAIRDTPALAARVQVHDEPFTEQRSVTSRVLRFAFGAIAVLFLLVFGVGALSVLFGISLSPYGLKGEYVDESRGLSLQTVESAEAGLQFRLFTTPEFARGFVEIRAPAWAAEAGVEIERHESLLGSTHYSATVHVPGPAPGDGVELEILRGHEGGLQTEPEWWWNRVVVRPGPGGSGVADVVFQGDNLEEVRRDRGR